MGNNEHSPTQRAEDQTEWREYSEWVINAYLIFVAVFTLLIASKKNVRLAKFSFFNTFLLALDIGTDLKIFLVLWFYEDHPAWAALTLFWIWVPFLIHLMKFFYQLYTDPRDGDFKDVLCHIPLVHPLYNGYLAYKLNKMRFGYKDFDFKKWPEVEAVQRDIAKAGLSENFFEAGPQSVQQLVIGCSTGRFSPSVIIGIVTSLLSLAWGASRAFFLERLEDEVDPDPALPLVAMWIFPLHLVVLTNSLFMWVLISGLMGLWTLLTLALIFANNLVSIVMFTKANLKPGSEAVAIDTSEPESSDKRRSYSLLINSALTALWLPAVVGDRKNMYLVAAITTLVSKLVILTLVLTLAVCGLQQSVFKHPFILWCEEEWGERAQEGLTLCTFDNNSTYLTSCFSYSDLKQKLRVCSGTAFETKIWIGLLTTIFTNSASLWASYRLNWLANYINLFKASKSLHRSAIFSVVLRNKRQDKELFEQMMLTPGIKDVVNRLNHAGTTPLHEACRSGDSWNVFLLWNAGAEPLNDMNGEKPELEDHLKKFAPLDKKGVPYRPVPGQGWGIQHVLDIGSIQTYTNFKAWDHEQGRAEQNILQLFKRFGVNVMSVATDGVDPDLFCLLRDNETADPDLLRLILENKAEKIRKWNSRHDHKCKF